MLDLIGREIAPHYYNKAIADTQALLAEAFRQPRKRLVGAREELTHPEFNDLSRFKQC